jgi:catecholate siderophore receptor
VNGSLAVLDPRIVRSNDVSSDVHVEGNRLGNVAARNATIWTTYTWASGVMLGGGLFYMGDRFTSNDNLVRIEPYTRVDLVAGYRLGRYDLQINLRNVFNARYYESAHNNTNVMPAPGRNGLIGVRARW